VTTIVFALFPEVTQLDFAAPAQALSRLPGARVVSATRDESPLTTDSGFSILPSHSFANAPQGDILCVPGGHGVTQAVQDPAMLAFVTRQAERARWVTAVCTGAFVLGAAGLLQGRRATTHWAYTHLLSKVGAGFAPGRVVEDGNLVTCGGVTAGLDFALTLIAREAGDPVAQAIQLALEYDPAPPFDSGHPSCAPERVTANLRERVYDEAAERMSAALDAFAGDP
jgi:cyclohexyl-isocyanide hydratase